MAMDQLEKHYAAGSLLKIDGLRVDYQDWWFLARISNTESVLRLVIEAKTQDLLNKKKEELSALLAQGV
ncbi:MAG: phosphomannomutase/phosphoglucomutase, partial [Candidatus Nealsonbacteria bacterium]